MKNKLLSILLAGICLVCLWHTNAMPANAASIVYTYSDMFLADGDIFYIQSSDNSNSIWKFDIDTAKKTKLLTGEGSINISYFNKKLYYSFYQENGTVTYTMTVNGKMKKKVCDGRCVYADSKYVVYLRSEDGKTVVYKKNTITNYIIKIASVDNTFDFVKNIGSTMYFYKTEQENGKIKLFSMKTNASKLTLLSTDKLTEEETSYFMPICTDVICVNGNLYYQYGTYRGTGMYWDGTVKKLDADGKKKTVTKEMEDDTFYYDSTNIYYSTGLSQGRIAYNTKTGKKTKYSAKVSETESYVILGSKTYVIDTKNTSKIAISRFTSGTNRKNLRKNFITIPLKQNTKYSYYGTIKKLGSYNVIAIEVLDFTDYSYGWKGRLDSVKWYIADSSGKIIGSL